MNLSLKPTDDPAVTDEGDMTLSFERIEDRLDVIGEGACLLQDHSIPLIESKKDQVVFTYYLRDRSVPGGRGGKQNKEDKEKKEGREEKGGEGDNSDSDDEDGDGDITLLPPEKTTNQKEDKGKKEGNGGSDDEDDDEDVSEDEDGLEDRYATLPLGKIAKQKEMEVVLDYFKVNFKQDTDVVRLVEFKGCSIEVVEVFLKAMASVLNFPPVLDPVSVLKSDNLNIIRRNVPDKIEYDLITGISLRATFSPDIALTLFVSFPYLGSGNPAGGSEGLSLSQYRCPGLGRGDGDEPVLVYQVWFTVFDNETIGIFRSDESSNRASLFPYQERHGGFQILVVIISNILASSEATALKAFRKKVSNLELQIRKGGTSTEDATREFELSLIDVSTMINVVRLQVQILENLQGIFRTSFESTLSNPRPHRSNVKLPVILNQKEQILIALETIEVVVKERRSLCTELSSLLEDLGCLEKLSAVEKAKTVAAAALKEAEAVQKAQEKAASEALIQAQAIQTAQEKAAAEALIQAQAIQKAQEKAAAEALKEAEKLKDIISKQGQTISVFTLITTVFLPLGFFSQYFAISIDGWTSPVSTPRDFWEIAGSATACIMVVMTIFLYWDDDKIKNLIFRRGDERAGSNISLGVVSQPRSSQPGSSQRGGILP